jgi:hypothetical protein
MRDDGGDVGCRLTKHRRVHGPAVRVSRRQPYGADRTWRSGGRPGLGVSYGATDDATDRRRWPAAVGRRRERVRSQSEEGRRVGQDQRRLTSGPARAERAPRPHLTGGVSAFWVLERERQERQLSFRGRSCVLPALERLRSAA